MNDCRRITRRVALSSAGLSLGAVTAAAMVTWAAAQQKLSQADAKYQTTPKGDQRCDGSLLRVYAVIRRRFPVGASPTRRPLQPEAIGAVMVIALKSAK